jgi:ABC-type oligopeptide transport system ATPase subunit
VTHNLAQARRISDHTIFFYEGRLVETGTTAELFEHPKRAETARYLGAEDDPSAVARSNESQHSLQTESQPSR